MAAAARIACHVVRANTAMPSVIATASTTPGARNTASRSNATTLPTTVRGRKSAACSMPGTRTSMPNSAVPVTFGSESLRGRARPTSVNSSGDFNRGDAGIGSAAAAAASSP